MVEENDEENNSKHMKIYIIINSMFRSWNKFLNVTLCGWKK